MTNQEVSRGSQDPGAQARPVLRGLLGGVAGLVSSLLLFAVAERFFPPVLGPVIAGQEELFDVLLGFTSQAGTASGTRTGPAAFWMYCGLWGFIGVLLGSGGRQRVRMGLILLVLYVLAGGTFYAIWGFLSLPT